MKILFDARLGLDGNTGISYVSKNILESIILTFGIDNVYLLTNITIYEFDIPKNQQILTRFSPFSISLFTKYPKEFDIIFCPHTSPQFPNKDQKLIFIIHDICFLYPFFWNKFSIFGLLKKLILKFKIKLVSKFSYNIITPSPVVKFYLKNILRISSIVIDNPISLPNITKIENFNYENYILYIGNLRKHKNIELLTSIIKKRKDLNFIFIGINENKFIENFGYYDNIIFKKNLDYNLYLNFILNANLVINTSLCEGFCIPIYESLILKKKVICLNIPIFRHLRDYLILAENNCQHFSELIDLRLNEFENQSKLFIYKPNISYNNYFNLIKNEFTNRTQ